MRVPQPLLLLGLFLCLHTTIFSQNWEDVISSISLDIDDDIDEDNLNILEDLYHNKFNINEITEEEASQLFFLSDFEQQSLVYYVRHSGPLFSLYELQFVFGLPIEKAKLISLFCFAKPQSKQMSIEELIQKGEHILATTTSIINVKNDVYKDYYGYEGNSCKEVIRYRFQSINTLYWGITLKKDVGESFTLKKGFDSQSMYVQIKNRGTLANLVVGDYKVSIGQGLLLSQGGSFVSSMEQSGGTQSVVLTKHSATSEYTFSRGVGATFCIGKMQITPFISMRKLDGKIKADTTFPFTIQKTGYHRTKSEIGNKKQINYRLIGIHNQLNLNRLRIGCAIVNHTFSKDSVTASITNGSIFYNYFYRHFRMYGECSIDEKCKLAVIQGTQYMLSEESMISTSLRFYQNDYQSFMSSASSNEEIAWSHSLRFSGIKSCNLYINNNLYVKPKGNTSTTPPIKGDVLKLKIENKTYSGVTSYYQYSVSSQTSESAVGMDQKQTHKLYSSFPISDKLQIKLSAQLSKQDSKYGILLYEDLVWKVKNSFSLSTRFAQFDAPYDNRLYAWEDDVMYVFSNSQYFYSGGYFYVVSKWKINEHWIAHIKISQCRYSDKYDLPKTYDLYEDERKIKANIMFQFTL